MTNAWDYTALAPAYADRPRYADQAVDAIVAIAGLAPGDRVCDVGAGTGHLTVPLATRGLTVDAVEPNEAMRGIGVEQTAELPSVTWHAGTGEDTGCDAGVYDLVSYGSSFNVVDQPRALAEAHTLLSPRGWIACLWNHRDLDDPLQSSIEELIARRLPGYEYGNRRADQRTTLRASGLFMEALFLEVSQECEVDRDAWVHGWLSHATLQRQAGAAFHSVVDEIGALVRDQAATLLIPYTTRVYLATAW